MHKKQNPKQDLKYITKTPTNLTTTMK